MEEHGSEAISTTNVGQASRLSISIIFIISIFFSFISFTFLAIRPIYCIKLMQ